MENSLRHIQGVKNELADYLSRLVKNHMLDEVATAPDIDDKLKEETILSLFHHNKMIPAETYVKIQSVHNSVVGHCGVETTMSRLQTSHKPWKYMRALVRLAQTVR